MISVSQALQIVQDNTHVLPTEHVELDQGLGRVLARAVSADADVPPFDRSIMDGFALIAEDTSDGTAELEVIESIYAGDVPQKKVGRGQTARIMTGAPIPHGADCVVMVENTETIGEERVRIRECAKAGQNINTRAEFVTQGDELVRAGDVLRAVELGVLAFVGEVQPNVYRRPVCAILSTGDELVAASEAPGPGQIRNSNIYCLAGQLERIGAEVKILGIGRDNIEELRTNIREGLEADVFVSTGGASVGEKDFVAQILQEEGVEILFNKVALKPGKPTVFGRRGETIVFGLPGNPVSAMVTCELFVLTALRKLMGRTEVLPQTSLVRRGTGRVRALDRCQYLPAKLTPAGTEYRADLVRYQGSGDLTGVIAADGLAIYQENEAIPDEGAVIEFLRF